MFQHHVHYNTKKIEFLNIERKIVDINEITWNYSIIKYSEMEEFRMSYSIIFSVSNLISFSKKSFELINTNHIWIVWARLHE